MKKGSFFSLLLLLVLSCSDDDLNSVHVDIIDNKNFITEEITRSVEVSSEEVLRVVSPSEGQYLFGVYNDPQFGTLQGSFVSQLLLPSDPFRYGFEKEPDTIVTSTIDDVVLYIPYQSTLREVSDEGEYSYVLDSIFGVRDYNVDPVTYGAFDFEVRQLTKFLNTLDSDDPTKSKVYYSDEDYDLPSVGTLLGTGTYAFSANDQVTYISRELNGVPYQDDEEISLTNQEPRIAIHLDKDFFAQEFMDKLPEPGIVPPNNDFVAQDDFIRYFKGLYVKATSGEPAAMASLLLRDAFVEMYYTNVVSLVSSSLNVDTIPKTKRFSFGGVKASQYRYPERTAKTGDKIYVQGAAGSLGNIKLLGYKDETPGEVTEELQALRDLSNNANNVPTWLINEASLRFYVDDAYLASASDTVYKLFLYKKVPEINGHPAYNSQLLDYITASATSVIEGDFITDENGAYYNFRITDYITELLDGQNTKNVDNFGLKLFNPNDYPTSATDTIVNSTNWNPRGVVMYSGSEGTAIEKRAVLRINYSVQEHNYTEE